MKNKTLIFALPLALALSAPALADPSQILTSQLYVDTAIATRATVASVTALDTRVVAVETTVDDLVDFANRPAGFATDAQGALADTALQSAAIADMATQTWVTNQNFLTAASIDTTNFATAAQGALADTAVQPAGLATAITNALTGLATEGYVATAITAATTGMATQTWVNTQGFITASACTPGQAMIAGAGGTVTCMDIATVFTGIP